MPLDKKHLTLLQQLRNAYQLEENDLQSVKKNLDKGIAKYNSLHDSLIQYIQQQKESKAFQRSLLSLTDQLEVNLSENLQEKDLLKILVATFLLSIFIEKSDWEKIANLPSFEILYKSVQKLKEGFEIESSFLEFLDKIKSDLQAIELQPIWHYLRYTSIYPILSQEATSQLFQFSNYLLKRKLGQSINDEDASILFINAKENYWEKNLLHAIDPDQQEKAWQGRILSCKTDVVDFIQSTLAHLNYNETSLVADPPIFWQDVLNILGQGLQTNLFSTVEEGHSISEKLNANDFTCIYLDLRKSHPYRYIKKSFPILDQQILNIYKELKLDHKTVSEEEKLLYWSFSKLGEQGMLISLLPANFLEDSKYLDLRKFLPHIFQEIFILECEDEAENLAVVFLIKKEATSQKSSPNIQHASLPLQRLNQQEKIEFEELPWQKIYAEYQDYWIGLPQSDFFDLLPIYGNDTAIFRKTAQGTKSLMEDWLIDISPNLLEKKVKYLLKQYAKLAKKKETSGTSIKWPAAMIEMAEKGTPLTFEKQKIARIEIAPFVSVFLYDEEKLLTDSNNNPAFAYHQTKYQVYPLRKNWHAQFWNRYVVFPLHGSDSDKSSAQNINDKALKRFKEHYQHQTKAHDQTFIVFPPERITQTLDKIETVSRDLPVISKYPTQINKLLEDARHFTSDVELLTPPYEKIDEFKRKVLRLERDAIERKVIYQKVKTYIEELKDQLATLTHEHDEALKDVEAISKVNIFYYTFAVLQDPAYPHKYKDFLHRELPRIPFYPKFRQWVDWGKRIHQAMAEEPEKSTLVSKIQVSEEILEKQISKSFTYQLHKERGLIVLKELNKSIALSNLPTSAFSYQFEGVSPIEHYLSYLSKQQRKNKKNKPESRQAILDEPQPIIKHLKHLCMYSECMEVLMEEMHNAHTQG
ncbi:type ISP restriction/modification enzyme [Catalinimonas sp. 4WD22]|uniref:type ISP restriction/modification enzyme n=1 Tax=Catalinimonas locisalis TaxID=3133978 RepID=UPI0031016AB3